jgi:hypothetical protein
VRGNDEFWNIASSGEKTGRDQSTQRGDHIGCDAEEGCKLHKPLAVEHEV